MKKLVLLSLVCAGIGITAQAQNDYSLWKTTSETALTKKAKANFDSHFKPAAYKMFTLNEQVFKTSLTGAPSEKNADVTRSGKIISVPDADGNLQQFRVAEYSVMAPQLAAKYPGIKTYIGQGVTDKTATIRFDVTPSGFHGMVTSASKATYYINPVDRDKKIYIVNARNANDKNPGFMCEQDNLLLTNSVLAGKATTITGNADDGILKTYDLALCVNGEFSQYFLDGTETNDAERTAKVMDVLVSCIVRANEVYERDFDIHLQYVANEDTLIFLDPATDPWPTKPPLLGSSWNSKTQQTIDARIGNANYDIGHLLGKVPTFGDNNGNAGCIGCVCASGSKGSGFTAYYDPGLLEYMVIDYWTHEMGHQVGANHTFDYNNEGTGANIEPGSGSTIMGYAGITGSTDVQPHSDDLFSVVSIAQVANNTQSGGSGNVCAALTVTGNHAPTANAGSDYTIPKSTPFLLTGSGSDVDAADQLTYVWEQVDVFEKNTSNKFPSPTVTTGPVFRVYNDSVLPVRSFPALSTILAGQTSTTWEALPAVDRDLNFRFTVRDNHIGGGNNKSDQMTVTVNSAAGPFVITSPNTAVTYSAGSNQTVTWDVASTNVAPINCTSVKISLSADGGLTFPYVLAASTPNDGSQVVTIPNVNSATCRVKVEAVGNIFFDIDDANFTVQTTGPTCPGQYDLGNNNKITKSVAVPLNTDVYGTISPAKDKDFYKFTITTAGTVSITLTNLPADYDIVLYNSTGNPIAQSATGGTANEAINTTLAAGDYSVRVKAKQNTVSDATNCYTLKIVPGTASKAAVFAGTTSDITSQSTGYKIYPNPVKNDLFVVIPQLSAKHQVSVFDAHGKMVLSQSAAQNTVQLNVSKLVAGMYFIKITNADGKEVYSTRFLKQ